MPILHIVGMGVKRIGTQESNMATTEEPNLTRETFGAELTALEDFLTSFAAGMGTAFSDRDSLHLTSPGWQALGVFHHDLVFRLSLSPREVSEFAAAAGSLDWSRYNPDWIPKLGQPEIDKFTGLEVTSADGRKRVSITGAGRSNVQNILDYVREKTGVANALSELAEEA